MSETTSSARIALFSAASTLSVHNPGPIASHEYRYLLTDLRSNAIRAEIPMKGVSYERKLSGIGDFAGKVPINNETVAQDVRTATETGKSGLYVLRDGEPVWGGIVWKRNYTSDSRTLSLVGQTFESYFYSRIQHSTKYWANTDQLDIARWLVTTSNNSAASVLIDVSTATSTRRRERTMYSYEFKTTGEELEQLSALIDGFDWNVEIGQGTDGALTRQLEFYYPRAGVSREQTQLFFEYPGSIKNFTVNEDAQNSGNSIWAIGGGEGSEQLSVNATDSNQLSQGWPMLELSRSYKSVLQPSTLRDHANSDRDRLRTPVTVFEVEVRADAEPVFGSYDLGDWARFRMEDIFLTPALDQYARITGISVAVGDSGGIETVSLTLGGDEATLDE